jgi:uncharacterized membrane protein YeaQ/YmgE (transglycosylase-associated protein family)
MTLVIAAFLGALAGLLASRLGREPGFGVLIDIFVGATGATLAGLLFPVLAAAISYKGGMLGELVLAIIGAVFLLLVVRAMKQIVG